MGWILSTRLHTYHPAALDRAADSINGVSTQGLGSSASCFMFVILMGGADGAL